jgi:chaperonin GroES
LNIKEKLIMSLRPLNDRILVLRVPENTETKGGIIIPDTAKEKPVEGTVVAIGNGRMGDNGKLTAMDVKVDDRVLFSKYGGTDVKIDGKDYLILRQDDVFGIIE